MPEINFYASSSAGNTDFTIKLSDVFPDGRSELVTRGWLNSS
jgi:predicted acyl esterase